MKIGNYPVKHRYKIARLVSDVFSLGLAILIFSVTFSFIDTYNELLAAMGEANVEVIVQNLDPAFRWRHNLAWIFPTLVVALFAVYIVLCCVSHPFKKYNVTKLTAQRCCDVYTFCASACKIPILMGIFDAMYIFHQRMLGENQSVFSFQILIDIVLIAIIIRIGIHTVRSITAPPEESAQVSEDTENTVKIKPVEREEK